MQKQLLFPANLSNSLLAELLDHLLNPIANRVWLQKIVNLMKQILYAKDITLITYIDNFFVTTRANITFPDIDVFTSFNNSFSNGKPYWCEQVYVVPVSIEGKLLISWEKVPEKSELQNYDVFFSMLSSSLKNRAELIYRENNILQEQSFLEIQNMLALIPNLKSQVAFIAKEIATCLNVSRCQIKFFDQSIKPFFEVNKINDINAEFAKTPYIEAIAVISSIEKKWLHKIQLDEVVELDQQQDKFFQDIESLLSIQSIFGYPLVYKKDVIGALILHQCDYQRSWKTQEKAYLKRLALLISILVGKELEASKKYYLENFDLTTGLINSDQFLREINRVQIKSKVKNIPFSLLMVDIEKLKDINLNLGFVAGNLVLSHTARVIKRLFADTYKIARYGNDEFVIIMNGVDHNEARIASEKLKEHLSNISVLGIGTIEYNFSFITYPIHSNSISEMLTLLEQSMLLSKSRGKFQISSFDEIKGLPSNNWQQLLVAAIPEIIVKKASLKTGPEIMETINKQITELEHKMTYNADILDSIQSLALALDAKDSYTEGHSRRVSEYAYLLAKELELDLQEVEWIRLAANMHDIGKIGIPESILCKAGKLTKEEYDVMKKHPLIGAKILKPIKPLEKVAALVLYHHEYWDGTGYPNGLSKYDIPIGARIVSIVDAYQAMTSNRPYRASLHFEEAVKRLKDGREKQWDPELIDLFIKIVSS